MFVDHGQRPGRRSSPHNNPTVLTAHTVLPQCETTLLTAMPLTPIGRSRPNVPTGTARALTCYQRPFLIRTPDEPLG
jgi:hypothetical protein